MLINNAYFWVGLGGAIGAMARVGLSALLPSFFLNLPLRILCINVIGCFIASVLIEVMAFYGNPSLNIQHFLMQGILGGFTTFSAFAIEFGLLYEKGSHYLAVVYAVLSVILSLIFFFIGLRFIRLFL